MPSCWAEGSRNTCQIRPCLTHPMTHTVGPQQHYLSPWEPSTEKWDGVLEQAGRLHWVAAWLPLPRQPGPTRLLSLLSHPGFICWLGPRLPPACLGFHFYNQPACAPYLSLLGGGGSTVDRSGQPLKTKQPSNYERVQSREAGPEHLQQPTTQPEHPAVTSLQIHHLV